MNYRMGDKFGTLICDEVNIYILARVTTGNGMALINTKTGNLYSEPVVVKNPGLVSDEDFARIADGDEQLFKKVDE